MIDEHPWNEDTRSLVESPFRLRFELGGKCFSNVNQVVPRFIQAFDRARHVAEAVFADSAIVAVVGASVPPHKTPFAPDGDGFRALLDVGFSAPTMGQWRAPRYRGDGELSWRCFNLAADRLHRDTLLWCSVSAEMAIRPKVPVTIYLIEPTRRIMLHVYDDRGMDVSALLPGALLGTYVAFDRWLLDYDRPRMAKLFEHGSATAERAASIYLMPEAPPAKGRIQENSRRTKKSPLVRKS
jgi:hypothetical protein